VRVRVLQGRETAAKRMIDLYQQQLQVAEKRTETLRIQRQRIKHGAH
jgi:hypothetical protein